MSDYTPTTEEVRRAVTSFNEYFDHPRAAEFDGDLFDRWLAEVKEQVWDECSYAYMGKIFETAITGEGILRLNNPYREVD